MGFLLLQMHCTSHTEEIPVCCLDGWRIVFAGRGFCTNEGEAVAIVRALDKYRIFIIGCSNVIGVTDHEPFTEVFGDKDLCKIHKPCLFKFKKKLLRYFFTIQHRLERGTRILMLFPVI